MVANTLDVPSRRGLATIIDMTANNLFKNARIDGMRVESVSKQKLEDDERLCWISLFLSLERCLALFWDQNTLELLI
jgi:hypothetical protein